MANHKSALKSIRQTAKRTARNKAAKSRMRTHAKKVITAVDAKDLSLAQEELREAMSVLASTAQRGIIHKNQASRRISRLNARVKRLALAQASV